MGHIPRLALTLIIARRRYRAQVAEHRNNNVDVLKHALMLDIM